MLAAAAPCFRAQGYELHVLSTGTERGPYAPVLEGAGYVVHHIPFARTPAYFLRFRRLLARLDPGITHVHCERASLLYAALASRRSKVVRTVHAWFDFTGWLRLRKMVERRIASDLFSTIHVAPSKSVEENERRRFGNTSRLCPNWYDDARFLPPTDAQRSARRRALGMAPDDLVVVSVGNHEPVKNYACGLGAFARVQSERRLFFLHVGRAIDPASGHSLPELADRLGLAGRALFVGQVDDVDQYLHAADLHLMPSLREGMGLAAIEAMASGLPQVLADSPGLADFKGLAPGVIHAPATEEGLAEALAAVAAIAEPERRAIGLQIAEAARSRFSTAAGALRYVRLYREISGDGQESQPIVA